MATLRVYVECDLEGRPTSWRTQPGHCRVCGCSDPCDEGCGWAEDDLCDLCEHRVTSALVARS